MDSAEIHAPHDEFRRRQDKRALTRHKTSWQDGYYDTRVKTAKQFRFVTYYIEQNPVMKELVKKPDEWVASSANRKELVTNPWPWLLDEE